jgi:hypothetical protein
MRWHLTKESGQRPECPLPHHLGSACVYCTEIEELFPDDRPRGAYAVVIWEVHYPDVEGRHEAAISSLTEMSLWTAVTQLRSIAQGLSHCRMVQEGVDLLLRGGGFASGRKCQCMYGADRVCCACISREQCPTVWLIQSNHGVMYSRKKHAWFYGSTDAAHCRTRYLSTVGIT